MQVSEVQDQVTDPSAELTIVANYQGVEVPDAPHFGPNMIKSMNEGRYERREVQAGLACIQKGSRVLELGAGSGIVGAILAKNTGAEQILSVEANPNLIDHVQQLYAHNQVEGLISVRHGVVLTTPDAPDTIEFFLTGNFLGSGLTVVRKPEKARKVQVPVIPYDSLLQEFPHNVIMMDIEGGELGFLRGADLSHIDVFIAEMHRNIYGREGMRKCRKLLAEAGMVFDQEHSHGGVHVYLRK